MLTLKRKTLRRDGIVFFLDSQLQMFGGGVLERWVKAALKTS